MAGLSIGGLAPKQAVHSPSGCGGSAVSSSCGRLSDAEKRRLSRLGSEVVAATAVLTLLRSRRRRQRAGRIVRLATEQAIEESPDIERLRKLRAKEGKGPAASGTLLKKVTASSSSDKEVLDAVTKLAENGELKTAEEAAAVLTALARRKLWEASLWLLSSRKSSGLPTDLSCHNVTIAACGRAQQWAWALAVLEGMPEAGLTPDAISLQGVLLACATGGAWSEALELMKELRRKSVKVEASVVQMVITSCARGGQDEAVLQLIREMIKLNQQPDMITLTTGLVAAARLGHDQEALDYLARLEAGTLDSRACNEGISACAKLELWDRVLQLFSRASKEQLELCPASIDAALRATAASGDWEKALELLRSVKQPDAHMMLVVRAACLQGGQWELAIQLTDEARKLGLPLDEAGSNITIHALNKLGRWEEALQLITTMVEQQLEPSSRTFAALMEGQGNDYWLRALAALEAAAEMGIPVGLFGYTTAIAACSEDAWSAALQLFEDMWLRRGMEPSVVTFGSAIRACTTQWKISVHLLQQAWTEGQPLSVVAYNNVLAACQDCGQGKAALAVLKDMEAHELVPDVVSHNAVIGSLGAEDANAAIKHTETMAKQGVKPTVVTFNTLANACRAGNGRFWETALSLLPIMRERAISPTTATYTSVAAACGAAMQWVVALQLLGAMKEDELSPNVVAMNAILDALAKAGKYDLCIRVLQYMPQAGVTPDIISYNTAIAGCENAGEVGYAMFLWEELQKKNLIPDNLTYASLMSACEKGKAWEKAVMLFQKMVDEELEPDSVCYTAAMNACTMADKQAVLEGIQKSPGAVAASNETEEAAEKGGRPVRPEGPSLTQVNPAQIEGAARLFREALRDQVFQPWIRRNRLLDLHGMNVEVAKISIWVALEEIPSVPEGDLVFRRGLRIIVGRGLHSDSGEAIIGPRIVDTLVKDLKLDVTQFDPEIGTIRIPGRVIRRLWAEKITPMQLLKMEGCGNILPKDSDGRAEGRRRRREAAAAGAPAAAEDEEDDEDLKAAEEVLATPVQPVFAT